uniref:Ubiquitin carboxyl-terminal hydrolase n=1 Tax=Caenorhabditis tropicalis TaxID=1561998 RepID=A0A1I7UMQ6_9PELO
MAASWTPLESNPSVINPMIEKMGVKGVQTVDVLFFEDESIGSPQYAVLLCFPEYKKVDDIMKPIYEQAKAADDSVFFMKQKISNACGTFALFHSLANLEKRIDLGNGSFAKWLDEAKKVGVEERSDLLANNAELAAIHAAAATGGQTAPSEDVEHHFICYVGKNEVLYEIDSRRPFAREIGPTTETTFVKDVGVACQHLIEKLDNVSFSAIALVDQ